MLTTGGYVSGPVALAAAIQRVPILVFLPDIEPAQSVKAVGRLAARIGATVEDSRVFLQAKKVVVTGYPLGNRITRWNRATGREALHLDPDALVLLVFGGSRGARSINRALMANLPALADLADVVHVSGELDWPDVSAARDALPESVQSTLSRLSLSARRDGGRNGGGGPGGLPGRGIDVGGVPVLRTAVDSGPLPLRVALPEGERRLARAAWGSAGRRRRGIDR